MSWDLSLFIFSVCLALGTSFLCSLMEATLLSLSPSQFVQLKQRHPKIGAIWQEFKDRINHPLTIILLLNTSANTVGAMVAGTQFEKLWPGSGKFAAFSLLFTYTILQFAEILPKSLGVRYNRYVAVWMAYPLYWFVKIFKPIILLIQLLNRPFQSKTKAEEANKLDEISALAGEARYSHELDEIQEQIIHTITFLDKESIEDVMIPVESITFLSSDMTPAEALLKAHLDPHTRFPVCEEGNQDRILGYINFKELVYHMHVNPNEQSMRGVIRPIYLASPKHSAKDLLKVFVERHEHIAIVRSDHGDTIGMVTLEDLVEQMIGEELGDEFDKPPVMLHTLAGDMWMVGGGVPVARLSKRLQYQLPCPDPEGTTFSEWLIEQFGKEPSVNDVIHIEPFDFTIRRMRRGKIFEASVSEHKNT